MRLVYGEDSRVRSWMRERYTIQLNDLPAIGIARDDGTLVCGTSLVRSHRFGPAWIDMEWAMVADSPTWARPHILREWFHYPFGQVGCARVSAKIAECNGLMVRTALHMGFRAEGRIRRGYDGKHDFIWFGMLRDECPWLEGSHAVR